MTSDNGVPRTAELFRKQALGCRELGSLLYADLLERAAEDIESGGPTRAALEGHLEDSGRDLIALRLFGGVHAVVLRGVAPRLAAYYPSAGGTADPGPGARDAWVEFAAVLVEHREELRGWLPSAPQTNEVARGAVLIGALCHLVAEAELPVRLVEIGASAGLNLLADHFRVDGDVGSYGDRASPVLLEHAWLGAPPPAVDVRVVDRTGGDLSPIDATSAQGRERLTAYVWADQRARFERLEGAFILAEQLPVDLRREPAAATLERTELQDGHWTVLWHSLMWMYLDAETRRDLDGRIERLGATATASARFAHVSLEPRRRHTEDDYEFLVRVTTWPGAEMRVLGVASPHGIPVTWEC
jgi:hypothetical protein